MILNVCWSSPTSNHRNDSELVKHINVRRTIESPFFARSCRSANLQKLGEMHCNIEFTLFKDTSLSQFYFPRLFSLLHIHTGWGQSKYVRKFEISRANFEKLKICSYWKNFSEFYFINMQNCSTAKELRHK